MLGDPRRTYELARRVLLDTLEGLGDQRDAIILVGAQAIYLHTGDADLAVAGFTTDADVAIDPEKLQVDPKLGEALRDAGLQPDTGNVGAWVSRHLLEEQGVRVVVDLMVPAAVGGAGRRGARLGEHGNRAARKAKGLEAALVDWETMSIRALNDDDPRVFDVGVAGPGALLIAKLHKIAERVDALNRSHNKDAFDLYMLLREVTTADLANGIRTAMGSDVAAEVTEEALGFLRELFSEPSQTGCRMAAAAVIGLESSEIVAESCAALAQELLQEISSESQA